MISGIEKFYCKSRLHAYIWRYLANKLLPALIPYFPSSPFVLEIGTGQGLGAIFLAEKLKYSRFIAIDYERDMVETAIWNVNNRGLQDRIRVEWGDAVSLNFQESSFDAVVSITVLHHVPGYEKAIFEAARVLKRGGFFMIVDLDFKASIFPRFDVLIGGAVSTVSWEQVSLALQNAGFDVLKIERYGMGMFASVAVKL
ncbi:MAG: methyltransferase domain-containing protein [Candidatus Methanoperedens sp.]|nr:methyltransferase domain-containing protein [Candidatus Methanoperedens sp.]MCZ7396709.1 methyltransferase domain-containing protein [Candidatus Methanoperedens sp.]